MENNAQPNEPAQNEVSKDSKDHKERRVSAAIRQTLEAWLWRRQQPEQHGLFEDTPEDEDDDDEATERKKKVGRFRAAFRSFFGTQVDKEHIPATSPSELKAENKITTPELGGEPVAQNKDTEVPFDPLVAAAYERRVQQDQPEQKSPTMETEIKAEAGVGFDAPQQSQESQSPEATTPINNAAPQEWVVFDHARQNHEVAAATPRAEAPKTELPEVTTHDLKKVEGKDYRRNRRRRRDIRRTNETVVALQKDQQEAVKQLRNYEEKLQQIAQQTKPSETVSRPLQYEQRPVAMNVPENRMAAAQSPAERIVERSPQVAERAPESVKQILEQRTTRVGSPERQNAERLARARYETVQAQTVLEQVEQAAEQNIAIEGLFERRHEKKDDQVAGAQSQGAAGGPQHGGVPLVPVAAISPSTSHTHQKQPVKDGPLNYIAPEYRQAARNGFWGAIIILLLTALLIFFG